MILLHTVGHCPEIGFSRIYLEYGKQRIIRFGDAEIFYKRTFFYALCLYIKIVDKPRKRQGDVFSGPSTGGQRIARLTAISSQLYFEMALM